ncbi:MAG TPA: hypothetical protein PKV73_01300 [Agriterribacter sp.]|nr:hypothetical protein [Agriterribacter sp.]
MTKGMYIVVSETEIVKAEMERPVFKGDYFLHYGPQLEWEEYIKSLPRIPIQGKHNWKVWQEVGEGKDFRFGLSDYTHFNLDTGREEGRPPVAIPIEQTKSEQNGQVFGEWQLCPKCNGQGMITGVAFTCDVCNGAKVLARPLLTNDNPQTP